MLNLKELQSRVIQNKINKGFNTKDLWQEFCLLSLEVSEACDAWFKEQGTVGEELADVAIYLLGIAEILNVDLEKEILNKININEKRKYRIVNNHYEKIKDSTAN